MENTIYDYIGLAVAVAIVAGAVWYFWPKVVDKVKEAKADVTETVSEIEDRIRAGL